MGSSEKSAVESLFPYRQAVVDVTHKSSDGDLPTEQPPKDQRKIEFYCHV